MENGMTKPLAIAGPPTCNMAVQDFMAPVRVYLTMLALISSQAYNTQLNIRDMT